MKRVFIIMCAAIISASAWAQPAIKLLPDKTVFLYADGKQAVKEIKDPVVAKKIENLNLEMKSDNGIEKSEEIGPDGNLSLVSKYARFDLYFPKNPSGKMVIVCPGGGYGFVSSYNEGVYVADWMLQQNVAVAVVKYRLPNGHDTVPLEDVQNAFRYCRAHASEWGVKSIGVMGFSAGGHLAASATTLYTDAETRPDFSVLIYPVISFDKAITHRGTRENLIGDAAQADYRGGSSYEKYQEKMTAMEAKVEHYSLENRVDANTPPVFLALCSDDTAVPAENSIRFYMQCINHGVKAEMHIFPNGGHGWGYNKYREKDWFGYAREEFHTSLSRWLESL